MSYYSEMQTAATEAQSVLAQLQGMSATATGNTLYNGETLIFVYGNPRVVEDMNPGGGYRRRVELPATATRTQFDAAPASKGQLTRIDISPRITYRIDTVDTNDPLVYSFTLVKVGE